MRARTSGSLMVAIFLVSVPGLRAQQPAPAPQSPPAPKAEAKTEAKTEAKPDPKLAPKGDPLLEAAAKAKAEKGGAKARKVLTEDDLSSLNARGVSIVGSEAPAPPPAASADSGSAAAASAKQAGEQMWRTRAAKLREQINLVDQEIAKVKEEIKKGGTAGFDVSTGMSKDVVYVQDRDAKLKHLEKQKAALEAQMDALRSEGLKAGADAAWFR